MNALLASFCNLPFPMNAAILKISVDADHSDMSNVGFPEGVETCTGLTSDNNNLYALFRSHGVFYVAGFTLDDFQRFFCQPLTEVRDGHSLFVRMGQLYVVSTGTDQVLRYELARNGIKNPQVIWSASEAGRDTHHVNSVAEWNGNIVVSCFGPKRGELWASAVEGYIHDIDRDLRIKDDIHHPHSLSVRGGQLYYCESSERRVASLDRSIFELDGYTRGVAWLSDDLVCIGSSVGRKVSKSTDTANPRDPGEPFGNCEIVIGELSTGRLLKRIDLGWFNSELYDLVAVPDSLVEDNRRTSIDSKAEPTFIDFNPIDHPIIFDAPRRLTSSEWHEHIPFGMLLVELLKPRTLVELGTAHGDTYSAFCQSVQKLGLATACYAIDTWQGDSQTGYYAPWVLKRLRQHHDRLYRDFSELIQSTFDEARARFDNGSIDLLHIDGYHSYEAVKHDFESWLPKVSTRGVILFHDIAVRQPGFGVWRLWSELKLEYPYFEFTHGHGLGVLVVGKDQPKMFRDFMNVSQDQALKIRRFFYQLGYGLHARAQTETTLRAELRDRALQIESHKVQVAEWEQRWNDLENGIGYPVLQKLQRVRARLAPPGTRREQWLLAISRRRPRAG